MIALLALVAAAETFEVEPAEDWCATANGASPGDEIALQPGEHGRCTLTAPGVIITGGNAARIAYTDASNNVLNVEADNIEISGLAFGPTQAGIDAVKIRNNANGVVVQDCEFSQIGGISVAANSSDSTGIRIVGNRFDDLQATGVYLGCHDGDCAARDYVFADNYITGVTSGGIGYGFEAKLNSQGLVRDNVTVDTQGPGLMVYGADDLSRVSTVEGNLTIGSRNNSGIEIGGGPAIVRNNIAVGGPDGGIRAADYGGRGLLRGIVILGNTVIGDGGPALSLASDFDANGNTARGNAGWQRSGGGPAVTGAENQECTADCWADVDALDFSPEAGLSTVAGLGLSGDFCAAARAEPTRMGALDSAPGPLPIGPKSDFACGGPGEGDDTGDDTGPGVIDTAPPSPPGCGCGAGGGVAAAWLSGLLALGLSTRRRRLHP